MSYRAYFFGSFPFPWNDVEGCVNECIRLLGSVADTVNMPMKRRLLLYDAQMLIALLRHPVVCHKALRYFEDGGSGYVYGMEIDWLSMPRTLFELYVCHASRVLHVYGGDSMVCMCVDVERLSCVLGGVYFKSGLLKDVLLSMRARQSVYRVCAMCGVEKVLDVKWVMGSHHRWLLDVVLFIWHISDRESKQRGQRLSVDMSLDTPQRRHVYTLTKRKKEVFTFRPPSTLDDNRLHVRVEVYMEFLYRFQGFYTGALSVCSGFMLICSALPHDWMFGGPNMSLSDQKRWMMYLPMLYKNIYVTDGIYGVYRNRISWGKKYYANTLLYVNITHGCFGISEDSKRYFMLLRDKLLNQLL